MVSPGMLVLMLGPPQLPSSMGFGVFLPVCVAGFQVGMLALNKEFKVQKAQWCTSTNLSSRGQGGNSIGISGTLMKTRSFLKQKLAGTVHNEQNFLSCFINVGNLSEQRNPQCYTPLCPSEVTMEARRQGRGSQKASPGTSVGWVVGIAHAIPVLWEILCTGGRCWQSLFWVGVLWDSSCFFVMRLWVVFTQPQSWVVFTRGGAMCAFCESMSMFWTMSGTSGMLGCGKAKEVALDDDSWAAVSPTILLLFLSRRVVVLVLG